MRIATVSAAAFLLVVSAPRSHAALSDWILPVERAVAQEAAGGFTGAVLIARGDEIAIDVEYPKPRKGGPAPHSRFILSSTAKQFVAAALLKCQERKLLSLDDPISKFFPQAAAMPLGAVRVRQLLTHTSGLPQGYASEDANSREQAVRLILAQEPTLPSGTQFQYSNENYQLAAAVVEVATHTAYATFLEQELLQPAGLHETARVTAANIVQLTPLSGVLPTRLLRGTWGMEGYYSTTRDLFNWYRALRKGTVLQPSSIDQLFTPGVRIKEGHAALGWFVGETETGVQRIFTRGNDDYGANSLIYAYPETDTLVIVLTHAGNNSVGTSWSRAILTSIERALFGVAS